MSIYRRFFASILVCGLLFGCILFIRLQLSDSHTGTRTPAALEFLPNIARFRSSRVCSGRALVLVHSSPARAQRRQVIRQTWAHPTVTDQLDISVAFGVGTAISPEVQRSLDWEAEIYGDIFQDFVAARSTSSRIVRLLKATRGACAPAPEFLLKTEDDVFLNTYMLGELLEIVETHFSSNTMWCLEWNRRLDKMGNNATWVVLKTRQSSDHQRPTYCIGKAYLMTNRALDAIIRRHEAQRDNDTLLPEHVYVTGMLTKEARVTLSLLGERFPFDDQTEEIDVGKIAFAYLGDQIESETQKLWRALVREKLDSGGRRSDVGL